MAQSETVKIGDKTFTATVLTVRQIRDILQQVEDEKYTPGVLDRLFDDGMPEPAFYASLGVEEKDIEELSPEDIKQLMEAVAQVNPTYAGMEKRVSASAENMEKLQSTLKELVSTSSR